jgi:hypothetical protein
VCWRSCWLAIVRGRCCTCCCTAFASSSYVPGRRRAAPQGGCWPLGTADPGCTWHQRVWIALLAAAQARLRPGRRTAARAIPLILNVIMPTQVALPLPPPWIAAHCGCCHLAFRPCHPRRLPGGTCKGNVNPLPLAALGSHPPATSNLHIPAVGLRHARAAGLWKLCRSCEDRLGASFGRRRHHRTDDLRITRVSRCVDRVFKAYASFMFAGCCWWRSLAADGGSGTSRGHARRRPVMRRPGARCRGSAWTTFAGWHRRLAP